MTELLSPRAGARRRFGIFGLLLAAAITMAGLGTAAAAHADPVDLAVVDRDTGRPMKVWRHEGRLYVAGRPGARYALKVTNNTGDRVLVVLSVDGVNIITGETAGYDQRGYIFGPGESYDLTGWRKSDREVAAFLFAPLPRSYAALTGRPGNVGVIGMAVFREKRVSPPPPVSQDRAYGPRTRAGAPAPPAAMRAAPSAQEDASDEMVVTAQRREEKLGTGHGRIEESVITIVPFVRATAYPQYVRRIDYDSYDNLVSVGVIRPKGPQPFPGQPDRRGYAPDPPGR